MSCWKPKDKRPVLCEKYVWDGHYHPQNRCLLRAGHCGACSTKWDDIGRTCRTSKEEASCLS